MKLVNIIQLNGIITVVTGLHIGAGNDTVEIGGLDNPIIRNPLTHEPYIPGSSLRGKMRFLAEWDSGKVKEKEDGKPHGCCDPKCKICKVFGTIERTHGLRGPTRLIVRDAMISESFEFDHQSMVETKISTAIDRHTGAALGSSLRNMERVAPGVQFSFEMIYRVFDLQGDNGHTDRENFSVVLRAIQLVENDTLGGCGSRGCGKVMFNGLRLRGHETTCIEAETIGDMVEKYNNASK